MAKCCMKSATISLINLVGERLTRNLFKQDEKVLGYLNSKLTPITFCVESFKIANEESLMLM